MQMETNFEDRSGYWRLNTDQKSTEPGQYETNAPGLRSEVQCASHSQYCAGCKTTLDVKTNWSACFYLAMKRKGFPGVLYGLPVNWLSS